MLTINKPVSRDVRNNESAGPDIYDQFFRCIKMTQTRALFLICAMILLTFMVIPAQAGDITPNPNLSGHTIEVTGSDTFSNKIEFQNYGNINILNGGTLTTNYDLSPSMRNRPLVNHGGSTLNIFAGGILVNEGDVLESGATLTNNGTINNSFSITALSGSTTNNYGTINNLGSRPSGGGRVEISIGGSSSFFSDAGTAIFNNYGTINNSGYVELSYLPALFNSVLNNYGTLHNLAGGHILHEGTINNKGTVILDAGSAYEPLREGWTPGIFNNNDGGTLVLNRDFALGASYAGTVNLNAGGTLQNNAKLTNVAAHTQDNNGTLDNYSVMNNDGLFSNNSGAIINNTFGATINNTDTLNNNVGATFINNGIFNTSTTFINNGRFQGTGTTNGNVINKGTIAPGNSIGTMTIVGNFTSNAGSTYEVEFNAAEKSDNIHITGTATLNGGTVSPRGENGSYDRIRYRYTILTADSGRTGVYDNLSFNGYPPSYRASLEYDPNNAYLVLTRGSLGLDNVCVTANQCAVDGALERISLLAPTGDMETVMNTLLGLNRDQVLNAWDQMGGYIHLTIPYVSFQTYNQYRNMMNMRMAGFVSGGPSSNLAARPIMFASRTDTGNDAQNALLAAAATQPGTALADNGGTKAPSWGFWMDGYGNLSQRRATDISSIYDYNTAGAIFGFDKKLTPSLLLGGSLGYAYSKIDLKDLDEKADMSSYQGSLYGIYTKGPFYISSVAGYAYNEYDTTRNMAFGDLARRATANYNGHLFAGHIEGGYRIKTQYIDVIPLASFQASHLRRDSFRESGADSLNLDADGLRISSFLSSLGVRLTKEYTTPSGTITPELRLRWEHEFSSDNHTLSASFMGYPTGAFTVTADRPDRDRLIAGAGLTWKMKNNVYLNLTYDGFFSSDTMQHAGMVGLQYRW